MAYKRSRKEFEADLQAQQSPFVVYGTPLPPLDPEVRDDGSFVPIWKQEVTDEQGRKRFHGAFTGGYSAGYFNTVGSKEGWTPSTFTSSRSAKQKNASAPIQSQQRAEDFMDDEDMADAVESQRLHTTQTFAGLGSTAEDGKRQGFLMDLLRPAGLTAGVKLLQKMGWRQGQGVGPKVLRKARSDIDEVDTLGDQKEHLFAPEDSPMISFMRKDDRCGLGFERQPRLNADSGMNRNSDDEGEKNSAEGYGASGAGRKTLTSSFAAKRSGIGVGIINDNGSDDEDPYEIGPRISYNRVIWGDKKKTKKRTSNVSTANPLLANKPMFKPKKLLHSKDFLRKCHDGRLPLDGFLLAQSLVLTAFDLSSSEYKIPTVPEDWKSSKSIPTESEAAIEYQSTADAAKGSNLDAKSRAAILGEAQLPGKSVFDYMSTAARDRLAAASGKTNLPIARGEALPIDPQTKKLTPAFPDLSSIPHLPKEVAVAALGRGIGGWMPYADDEAKRCRYRAFLELQAGLRSDLPEPPPQLDKSAWKQEFHEFVRAAQVFKPMTGAMASRFTTSSASSPSGLSEVGSKQSEELLSRPSANKDLEDPAEAAARMGLFGPMTRSIHQFYPTRLLCKRFNVKPPAHVQPDSDGNTTATSTVPTQPSEPSTQALMSKLLLESGTSSAQDDAASRSDTISAQHAKTIVSAVDATVQERVEVDTERNDALEGKRAGEAVFKAIFGSDDESD